MQVFVHHMTTKTETRISYFSQQIALDMPSIYVGMTAKLTMMYWFMGSSGTLQFSSSQQSIHVHVSSHTASITFLQGGDLMDLICAQKRLDEETARRYTRQIISAIDYLHKAGILHR